jgi:hypothetical protein
MKKITAILLGTLIASSAALASTNQVLSRNAVGYVKVDFPKGFTLVQNTFNPMGAPIAISNTFASLPNNSRVHIWNGAGYSTITKAALGGWGAGGSNLLQRGSGFWIEIPQAAASNSYPIFFMGEVPDDASTVVPLTAGFNMKGYPYPVSDKWTNTPIAKASPNNSKLHIWTGSNYNTFTRAALGGWNSASNVVLNPGQAFWVEFPSAASSTNVSVTKPYTWP